MIYFVMPVEGGPIKIGCTDRIEARLKDLRRYYDRDLTLLRVMPGDYDREREIHEQFAHLRIRHTEQFQPGAELLEFIGAIDVEPRLDAEEMAKSKYHAKIIFQTTVSAEYMEWVRDLAHEHRCDVNRLLDRALRALAKKEGFEQPPMRVHTTATALRQRIQDAELAALATES